MTAPDLALARLDLRDVERALGRLRDLLTVEEALALTLCCARLRGVVGSDGGPIGGPRLRLALVVDDPDAPELERDDGPPDANEWDRGGGG